MRGLSGRTSVLGELNWDTYWRFETFRRACDPLDFRRWKRDSQRALRRLHPGDVKLLDSTTGMGDHTVNLAELGFRVTGCDGSEVAREYAANVIQDAGLDVPLLDLRWENIGEIAPERFDLIFNDALHWTYDEEELLSALRSFRRALVPGGALVFFFADAREPDPKAGLRLLEWDWEHLAAERVEWDHTDGERRVTLTILAERGEDFIDEHHLFHDRRGDQVELHTLTMRRVYRWDWAALTELLRRAGFRDIQSEVCKNEAKGYTFALNRAFT
ncbi:MAG: class I SAM-dependent methyltransferase [Myxococcota bacterium]